MAVSLEPMTARPAAVPPFSLLEMVDQSFERYTRREKPSRPRVRTWLARLVTFGGALGLTGYATREMIEVVSVGGVTMLQGVMVVLFAITFAWIALAAASADRGRAVRRLRPAREGARRCRSNARRS